MNTATSFVIGVIRAVIKAIPTTFFAILIGAIVGGFLGIPFGPVAPLTAVIGAVVFGLPVAIWEFKISSQGNSAWDYIEEG